MAEKVEIIIEADDQASGTIQGVSGELENLTSIAAGEALREGLAATADLIGDLGVVVGDFVDAAADAEVVQARMKAQLKALGNQAPVTADQINEIATVLSEISGFDDEALVEGMGTLTRFGNLSEEQFKKASEAATDLAAITGMDVVSAFRQVGIALDNPEQGFGRLKRQIGDLTDAEKAQIKALMDMGDVAGAQAIILDALSQKTQGAAEAMGNTFAGKVDIATLHVQNFMENAGTKLTDMLKGLPQWAFDAGVAMQTFGGQLSPILGDLANIAIIMNSLRGFKGGGGGAVGVGGLLGGLQGVLVAALEVVNLFVMNSLSKMGASAGLKFFEGLFGTLPEGFRKAGEAIQQYGLLALVHKEYWQGLGEWIGSWFAGGIGTGFSKWWQTVKVNIIQAILDLIAAIQNALKIGSPSKVMANMIGKPMAQGLQMGFAKQLGGMSLAPVGIGARAGGSGPMTVVVNYSPGVSIADRADVSNRLVPYVREAMRRL